MEFTHRFWLIQFFLKLFFQLSYLLVSFFLKFSFFFLELLNDRL